MDENSVIRNFRITANDGKEYDAKHYNLDVILAEKKALAEYEKYRSIQDKNYISDFDREVKKLLTSAKKKL